MIGSALVSFLTRGVTPPLLHENTCHRAAADSRPSDCRTVARARGDAVRVLARGAYPELVEQGSNFIVAMSRTPRRSRAGGCGCDAVIHTAAVAGIWGPWSYFYGINTVGTEKSSPRAAPKKLPLVYTSSPSVVFDAADQAGIDESTPYPTKWLARITRIPKPGRASGPRRQRPRWVAHLCLATSLDLGPAIHNSCHGCWNAPAAGNSAAFGDGRNLIDMIYVDNAAAAHLQALDALCRGRRSAAARIS